MGSLLPWGIGDGRYPIALGGEASAESPIRIRSLNEIVNKRSFKISLSVAAVAVKVCECERE